MIKLLKDILGSHKYAIDDLKQIWYRFKQNRLSLLSVLILSFLFILIIFSYQLAPYPEDATKTHFEDAFQPPSMKHPFGTDDCGRDILSRIIIGSRISIPLGVSCVIASALIGVSAGLLSGYSGGIVDTIMMRTTEVFLSIPRLVFALVVSAFLTPSLISNLLAISSCWWTTYARIVRGEVLRIREKEYIESARSVGASSLHIMFKEILPNVITPIIIRFTLDIGFAILTLAMLGFLGLGARPPTPEWGSMAGSGRNFLPEDWWMSTFPGLMIFLTVYAFNLFGDGLRDAIVEQ